MNIEEILQEQRRIWGHQKQDPAHILSCLLVIIGDVARQLRAQQEGGKIDKLELEKELGNLITSTIRWCDDMDINVLSAIESSLKSHGNYQNKN